MAPDRVAEAPGRAGRCAAFAELARPRPALAGDPAWLDRIAARGAGAIHRDRTPGIEGRGMALHSAPGAGVDTLRRRDGRLPLWTSPISNPSWRGCRRGRCSSWSTAGSIGDCRDWRAAGRRDVRFARRRDRDRAIRSSSGTLLTTRTIEASPFTAVNAALIRDGAFVHVAAGVVLPSPLHVVYVTTGGAASSIDRTAHAGRARCRCRRPRSIESFVTVGVEPANAVSDRRRAPKSFSARRAPGAHPAPARGARGVPRRLHRGRAGARLPLPLLHPGARRAGCRATTCTPGSTAPQSRRCSTVSISAAASSWSTTTPRSSTTSPIAGRGRSTRACWRSGPTACSTAR